MKPATLAEPRRDFSIPAFKFHVVPRSHCCDFIHAMAAAKPHNYLISREVCASLPSESKTLQREKRGQQEMHLHDFVFNLRMCQKRSKRNLVEIKCLPSSRKMSRRLRELCRRRLLISVLCVRTKKETRRKYFATHIFR